MLCLLYFNFDSSLISLATEHYASLFRSVSQISKMTLSGPHTKPPNVATEQVSSDTWHDGRGKQRGRSVTLRFFLLTVACLVFAIIALGLGLGLGLGLNRAKTTMRGLLDTHEFDLDYSTFYGIPDDLPTVADEKLTNLTELDLRTGFIISNVSQAREYTFSITQALAAPDGKCIKTWG